MSMRPKELELLRSTGGSIILGRERISSGHTKALSVDRGQNIELLLFSILGDPPALFRGQ